MKLLFSFDKNFESIFYLGVGITFQLLFVGIWVYSDPLLHVENYIYLQYLTNLNGAGWLTFQKIFDVCGMEACFARFRPFGTLFHLLDDFFIVKLNHYIPYHFRSLTLLISGISIAFTFTFAFYKLRQKNGFPFSFMLGSYATMLPVLLVGNTMFFRPGKYIVAWLISFLFYLFSDSINSINNKKNINNHFFYIISSILVITLTGFSDEQAIFFIFLFTGAAIIYSFKNFDLILMLVLLSSSIIQILLYLMISPLIIINYATHPINYTYSALISYADINVKTSLQVIEAMFTDLMMIFGNAPSYGFLVISINFIFPVFIFTTLFFYFHKQKITVFFLLYLFYFCFGYFILLYIMGIAHYPVLTIGSRLGGYYSLPPVVFLFGLISFSLIYSNILSLFFLKKFLAICLICWSILSIFNLIKLEDYFSHRNLPKYIEGYPVDIWEESKTVGRIIFKCNDEVVLNKLSPHAQSFIIFSEREIITKSKFAHNCNF